MPFGRGVRRDGLAFAIAGSRCSTTAPTDAGHLAPPPRPRARTGPGCRRPSRGCRCGRDGDSEKRSDLAEEGLKLATGPVAVSVGAGGGKEGVGAFRRQVSCLQARPACRSWGRGADHVAFGSAIGPPVLAAVGIDPDAPFDLAVTGRIRRQRHGERSARPPASAANRPQARAETCFPHCINRPDLASQLARPAMTDAEGVKRRNCQREAKFGTHRPVAVCRTAWANRSGSRAHFADSSETEPSGEPAGLRRQRVGG